MGTAARLVSPVATLVLALLPVRASGQAPSSARDAVVWHWFGDCAGGDSLMLEISLDAKDVYTATFPICQVRRTRIKPEPQQRLLAFRFDAVPRRFGPRSQATTPQPIACNIWEAGGEANAIQLGISFALEDQVLLNAHHMARIDMASRSQQARGLVITTRPVRRRGKPK